jgi:hypothetical protein
MAAARGGALISNPYLADAGGPRSGSPGRARAWRKLVLPLPFGPVSTVSGPIRTSHRAMLLKFFRRTRLMNGTGCSITPPWVAARHEPADMTRDRAADLRSNELGAEVRVAGRDGLGALPDRWRARARHGHRLAGLRSPSPSPRTAAAADDCDDPELEPASASGLRPGLSACVRRLRLAVSQDRGRNRGRAASLEP